MWIRALAVLGGAALLGSLFLPWYEHFERSVFIITRGVNDTETVTLGGGVVAWRVFTVTDVVLATIALSTPVIAFRRPSLAPVFGALAVALVVFRLIEPPGPDEVDFTLGPGAGLAIAGAVALCAPWAGFVAPLVLLASLWMPWYGSEPVPDAGNLAAPLLAEVLGSGPGESWFAWDTYTLTAVAIGALALAALRWRWVAGPAVLLVGAWIAFPPDGLEPRTGAFIALGAACLATFAPRPEPAA